MLLPQALNGSRFIRGRHYCAIACGHRATAPATIVLGDVWGIEWAIATSCVLYGIVVALAYVGPMRVHTKASERVGAS